MNERLKLLRKHLGFTQAEMAEKMNLSQTHISALENGSKGITDRLIDDICRIFYVNEEWLRTEKGDMFAEQAIDEEFAELIAEATLKGNDSIKELMIMANKLNDRQLKILVNFLETMIEDKK
ncbi:helix-turn-helix domain-containing protein [Lysinibacillus sp. OF-1]|uniref:helix-turn-helix domain-containing protein n=1 Tax=Lysinibacillus sp. OF-1 TaxID=2972483 RepID=UPI00232D7D5B|nr:helix-turn-helix transcriptional regulator [Lysinibacillus sp. OF-1]WCH46416.1 helix-turn-helix transcriptional regulator [Lysinibacillus sp. OF-1]